MSNNTHRENHLLFSLDIGTRNVVGVVAEKHGDKYNILDYEMMEHPERAMYDGQIHDIEKVTSVVKKVKENLEERNNYVLDKVAVAAAGRALKTEKIHITREIDSTEDIDKLLTDNIEMEGIQTAQEKLVNYNSKITNYYCVGYSVIDYHLDGSLIMNPIGHRGQRLEINLIATFLPQIVVDSLYSVINKSGLEVLNMTLEPIAAMSVCIPKHLRMLNLALVDIGAGTSDIAISKDGTVEAYGMVASAGDKITEALAQNLLVDFNTAERIKREIYNQDKITYTDVLGIEHKIGEEQYDAIVGPAIEELGLKVANEIQLLNGKSPSAVFCIGGGSLTKGFTEKLSEQLNLPKERVALKTAENLDTIAYETVPLSGPEFVTPIGIGVTAFEEKENDFLQVFVNELPVRMFNTKRLSVSDALILSGFNARQLLAPRGESFYIHINGRAKEIKGEYGQPAKIYVNGRIAALDDQIHHKDIILVEKAESGSQKICRIDEVIKLNQVFYLNDVQYKMIDWISVNDIGRTGDYVLKPDDVIKTYGMENVNDVYAQLEIDKKYYRIVNKKHPEVLLQGHEEMKNKGVYSILKINKENVLQEDLTKEYFDQESLKSEYLNQDDSQKIVKEVIKEETIQQKYQLDNEAYIEEKQKLNDNFYQISINGETIHITTAKESLVVVDIFDYYAFDLSQPKGMLYIEKNGQQAKYTDRLNNGDNIKIGWK